MKAETIKIDTLGAANYLSPLHDKEGATFVTENNYIELKALARDGSISLSALCNDIVTTALCKKRSRRMK